MFILSISKSNPILLYLTTLTNIYSIRGSEIISILELYILPQLSFARYITKGVQMSGNVFRGFNTIIRVYNSSTSDGLIATKETLILI